MKELFNFFVSLGKYFYKLDEVGALPCPLASCP